MFLGKQSNKNINNQQNFNINFIQQINDKIKDMPDYKKSLYDDIPLSGCNSSVCNINNF
jgi:hypothetical protein